MRLKEKYTREVVPEMMRIFGYKNKLAVPKIEKVVLNVGFGKIVSGKTGEEREKPIDFIVKELSLISGQKPLLTRARGSISGFKVRKGTIIGAKVTLRGKRMYDFIERLINIVLPRIRDFKGISPSSVDKDGNLTIGIKEHIVFPEVSPEKAKFVFGLEVTVVTNVNDREKAISLLKLSGFPLK